MTPEEFFRQFQANAILFNELEGGTYSKIYITKSQYAIDGLKCLWVIREPRQGENIPPVMSSAEFAWQKWKRINPQLPAFYSKLLNIWVVPFLGKRQPSALSVQTTVWDIYQKTGIILADGFIRKNFLNKGTQTFCIDMDYAIDPTLPMCDLIFNQIISTAGFDEFFSQEEEGAVQIKNLIKTLFYLEQELRHVAFNRALLTPWMIKILHRFCEGNYHIYVLTLDILLHLQEQAVNPSLINPETILLFMFHWNCTLTKEQIETILDEIQQHMRHVPNEAKAAPVQGFFEHLNKRLPYTGRASCLSF